MKYILKTRITELQASFRLQQLFAGTLRTGLNGNAMYYEIFIYFYVSEAKSLCFSLCSQMFDDVEQC